ncbi:hypothetical protein PN36_14485 [Candidatus Thiomargarita nelsonii]|uniref:Uncharacterized protein n=1 Tax=Candidatus Thiomargarita nelsonii TaxID=1003181 RepID=A0A0A6PPY2_9GAMM|nr:hypothetical protein PN36_14485 [Candidatus Thiomargarita nelsonii]
MSCSSVLEQPATPESNISTANTSKPSESTKERADNHKHHSEVEIEVVKVNTRGTRNLIGTWRGKTNDQEVEISLWLGTKAKLFTNASLHGVNVSSVLNVGIIEKLKNTVNVRGYAIFPDDQCVQSIEGSLNDFPFNFSKYKISEKMRYKSLIIKFTELKGYSDNCQKFLPTTLIALHDGSNINQMNVTYLLDKNKEITGTFTRVSASPEMLTLIKKNPLTLLGTPMNLMNKPTNQELSLIKNPKLARESLLKQFKIPCDEQAAEAIWVMKQHNIKEIKTLVNADNTVEVTFQMWEGKQSLGIKTLTKSDNIDWEYVSMSFNEMANKQNCRKASAVLNYFQALDAGQFNTTTELANDFKSIEDVKDFYLVDMSGVDKITYAGDSMYYGAVERVFGTTTIYLPGDLTRRVLWNMIGQSLKIVNTAKNSKTGQIEEDILSKPQNVIFRRDKVLSQKLGTDIWNSRHHGKTEPSVCIQWADKHHINTCVKWSKPTQAHRYYLTKDLEAAKRLFMTISPNARMISSRVASSVEGKCISKVFCDLPGGDYLNAIYEGDIARVRKLDKKYLKSVNDIADHLSKDNIILKGLFELMMGKSHPSLLSPLAVEYMHDYKHRPKRCFKPGAQKLTLNTKTDTYITYDLYGNKMSEFGGIPLSGEYLINAEFVNLCKNICRVRSWGTALSSNLVVISSIPAMRRKYDCDSKEIKQFEKNLISMQALKHSGYRVYYRRNSP